MEQQMVSPEEMNRALRDIGIHHRVREQFKASCGDGARYHSSEFSGRDGHYTIAVCFEIIPEGRKFHLDGVIHEPCGDSEIKAAVAKIADIAKNVRQHISTEA